LPSVRNSGTIFNVSDIALSHHPGSLEMCPAFTLSFIAFAVQLPQSVFTENAATYTLRFLS